MRHCSSNQQAEKVEGYVEREGSSDINIGDCFNEFKKTEILDEDNMWYCNKCKEHVRASKKFELYKVPPVFCVSLKRFK
jgi:ubiquitin carboxyl-terminal hydrolase 4/11/15